MIKYTYSAALIMLTLTSIGCEDYSKPFEQSARYDGCSEELLFNKKTAISFLETKALVVCEQKNFARVEKVGTLTCQGYMLPASPCHQRGYEAYIICTGYFKCSK